MKIYKNVDEMPILPQCVAAIGNFDGVHIGHTALIEECVAQAKELNVPSVLITFDPHPRSVLSKNPVLPLVPLHSRLEHLEEFCLDFCCVLPFTREFASQDAEIFIKNFLYSKLHCKELIIGYNFKMGADRLDAITLKHILNKYDCIVSIHNEVYYEDESNIQHELSSSVIRKALEDGNIALANGMLGRKHCVEGLVQHGAKRGSAMLGFPTANMDTGDLLLPKAGVYATYASFPQRNNSVIYKSISNIGYNPTFAGDKLVMETYLIDFKEEIYGQMLNVCFLCRIRDEKKFATVHELIDQLNADEDFRLNLV